MGQGPDTSVEVTASAQETTPGPAPKPQNPKIAVAAGFEIVEESDPTVSAVPDPMVLERYAQIIRGGGRYSVGRPYEIAGELFEPKEDPDYDSTGLASWYGEQFHGRLTANGEIFDRNAITAAHPTLPLPSYVRITNMNNDRSIIVRVNDRGPFKYGRLIDVSEKTAALLGFHRRGLTNVRVQYVSRAPLAGDDKEWLLASYDGPKPSGVDTVLATERAQPILARAFAYAPEPQARPAEVAIRRLSQSVPAAERIRVAFLAAEEAEE